MSKINVVDMAGKVVSELELNDAVFGIEPNRTAWHQSALGHAVHTYPYRGKRRRQEAVASEGHGSRKTGLDKSSAVETRRYRAGSEAPFLQIFAEQEGKTARYQVGAV